MRLRLLCYIVWGLATVAVAACGGGGSSSSGGGPPIVGSPTPIPTPTATATATSTPGGGSKGKIKHVIIIIQENRSFDNLFYGYPGADTAKSGYNSHGVQIQLKPVSLATQYVIDHSATAMFAACNGSATKPGTDCQMNGFDREQSIGGPVNPQYVFVPHSESAPYFSMANQYVLADRMFQSHLDESYVAHQYLIAAQAQSAVGLPNSTWGCDDTSSTVQTITKERTFGKFEQTCFDYTTLGDELDAAGLPWRFYTSTLNNDGGEWSGYQAVRHIRFGPDWASDVLTPQTRFLTDVSSGQLAAVTWITPICHNSDHVNCGGGFGPSWVTSLVNAVGESKFWSSTAIFVTWDDWGGLYDHVPPPYLDYDGLGFRVPLLMISPYAKKGYVSHTQYEFGSILRFAEDQFHLGRLAASDSRAASPAADSFDFHQSPRPFTPIQAPLNSRFFMMQMPDGRPPDYE
jgi:phospholipase C